MFRAPLKLPLTRLVAAALLVAPTARAEAQIDLRWEAPAGCPRRDEVLARMRTLAGASLDDTQGLSAEASIARSNGRFVLTLLVRDGREVRERLIASDTCADLAGAAAVTLVLLLGGEVRSTEPGTDGQTKGPATSPGGAPEGGETSAGAGSERKSEERKAPGSEPRNERKDQRAEQADATSQTPSVVAPLPPWAVVVRAPLGSAELGPLPGTTLGVGFGGGLRIESWRILLLGHLSRGQTVNAGDSEGAFGAELGRMTARVVACHGWRSRRFELAPCVGLALERVTARGFGDGVSPESEQAIWPAPGAGAVAHWYTMESLAFFVEVAGHLELSRPRLVVQGLGEVAELSPVGAGIALGAEWIL